MGGTAALGARPRLAARRAALPRRCTPRRPPHRAPRAAAAPRARSVLLGGLEAETAGDSLARPGATHAVLVVPGNPGVADYYADFCAALREQLGAGTAVCGARGNRPARCAAAAPVL